MTAQRHVIRKFNNNIEKKKSRWMLWRRGKIRLNIIYVEISFCTEALTLFPLVYYYYFFYIYVFIEKKHILYKYLYVYDILCIGAHTTRLFGICTKNQFIRNSVKVDVDIVLSDVPREMSTWVNRIYTIYPTKNKIKGKKATTTPHGVGHRHTRSRVFTVLFVLRRMAQAISL